MSAKRVGFILKPDKSEAGVLLDGLREDEEQFAALSRSLAADMPTVSRPTPPWGSASRSSRD